MPRRRRIIFPGLPHHVTHRGNRKAAVYLDQQDREFYLDQLQKYTNLYEIQIYAYCLTARGKSRVGSRAPGICGRWQGTRRSRCLDIGDDE